MTLRAERKTLGAVRRASRPPVAPCSEDWLRRLTGSIADDVIRAADVLADAGHSRDEVQQALVEFAAYLASDVAITVEMAADTWAATR